MTRFRFLFRFPIFHIYPSMQKIPQSVQSKVNKKLIIHSFFLPAAFFFVSQYNIYYCIRSSFVSDLFWFSYTEQHVHNLFTFPITSVVNQGSSLCTLNSFTVVLLYNKVRTWNMNKQPKEKHAEDICRRLRWDGETNNVQIVFIAFFKQENGLFVVLFRINRNAV
jgi:hypothetical protein